MFFSEAPLPLANPSPNPSAQTSCHPLAVCPSSRKMVSPFRYRIRRGSFAEKERLSEEKRAAKLEKMTPEQRAAKFARDAARREREEAHWEREKAEGEASYRRMQEILKAYREKKQQEE